MALELVRCAEHLRDALDEREAFLLEERFRARLAVHLDQLWFMIEEIELRRGTGHVQVNDPLGLGGKMRGPWRHRVGQAGTPLRRAGAENLFVQEGRERKAAQPNPATAE